MQAEPYGASGLRHRYLASAQPMVCLSQLDSSLCLQEHLRLAEIIERTTTEEDFSQGKTRYSLAHHRLGTPSSWALMPMLLSVHAQDVYAGLTLQPSSAMGGPASSVEKDGST